MQRPKYRINPSLLNAFADYVNSDSLWGQFYGSAEDPAMTAEEFAKKQEQDLLDAINRVEKEPIESADRGTCLNEIVDCILERRKPKDGITLSTVRDQNGEPQHITAQMDGFSFNFDAGLCLEVSGFFRGSICQHLCEATISTSYGPVILYGYADYIRRDVVYDLKTTGNYAWGKYEDGWQKDLYPWCLIESGELQTVSGFEYTPVKLYGGGPQKPIITGEIYHEWYDYNHEQAEDRLRGMVESFVSWIELNRSRITHQRIFNL